VTSEHNTQRYSSTKTTDNTQLALPLSSIPASAAQRSANSSKRSKRLAVQQQAAQNLCVC